MLGMDKPESKSDMLPPFELRGEDGWEGKFKSFLQGIGLPMPSVGISLSNLESAEKRIGVSFPNELSLFLSTFGPMAFGRLQFLELDKIVLASECWIAKSDQFPDDYFSDWNRFLCIADLGGSGDFVSVNIEDKKCYMVGHDPVGITSYVDSVSDLVRMGCIASFSGKYGWPDEYIENMGIDLMNDLFGRSL